jgi:hypothetical protein
MGLFGTSAAPIRMRFSSLCVAKLNALGVERNEVLLNGRMLYKADGINAREGHCLIKYKFNQFHYPNVAVRTR